MLSTQAGVAKSIRKELKEKFPGIKFSVRSESFAGGNSVDIDYTDGVPADEIRKIVDKYESGHFDGMTDCYNYFPGRDYPTAKYVMVQRNISKEAWQKTKEELAGKFGIEISNEQDWFNKLRMWSSVAIHRELVNKCL